MEIPRIASAMRSADNASVRRHNLTLILNHVRSFGPIARSEIADSTGLTKGSVTGLTSQLLKQGLLEEHGSRESLLGGRRLSLLQMGGSQLAVLAVQIRVNELVVRAVTLAGEEVHSRRLDHGQPIGQPGVMADQITGAITTTWAMLRDRSIDLVSIAIVVAAPVQRSPIIVPLSVDFGWVMVDIVDLVSQRLRARGNSDIPISLLNDASMAALAERDLLARQEDQQFSNLIYLKSNTGIGGAAIVDGQMLRGAQGVAFEPGHISVDGDRLSCACGQRGCLVTVAGPEVVVEAAGLGETLAARGILVALDDLVAQARQGDRRTIAALTDAAFWVNRAIAIIRLLFNPEIILMGGYWADLFDVMSSLLERDFPDSADQEMLWGRIRIEAAQLGEKGAIDGALELTISRVLSDSHVLGS